MWRFWNWLEEAIEIVAILIVVAIAIWAFFEIAKTTTAHHGFCSSPQDCYLDYEYH